MLLLFQQAASQVHPPLRPLHFLGEGVYGNYPTDVFVFVRNTAALAHSGSGAAVYAEKKFMVQGLHTVMAAGSLQLGRNGIGGWAGWSGTTMLSHFTGALAFGKSLGKIDAGIELSYQIRQQHIYPIDTKVQASFGFCWQVADRFRTAVQVNHFLPDDTGPPLLIEAGWGWQCADNVLFWMQTSKETLYPASWEAGIQYAVLERLRISGGWNGKMSVPWIGCCWKWDSMQAAVFLRIHPLLGPTPSMQWNYVKKAE